MSPRPGRRVATLRARLLAAAGVALSLPEPTARAEGGYVSGGVLAGGALATGRDASAGSIGAELSWSHYRARCCWDGGLGGFLQAQRYYGDGASYRFAAGYQYPGALGFEAGAGVRVGERGTSPQLHLAPFFSIGLAHVALRASPAIGPYGSELGLFIGLKLPVPYGDPPPQGFSSGRPLRVGDEARVAPLVSGRVTGW